MFVQRDAKNSPLIILELPSVENRIVLRIGNHGTKDTFSADAILLHTHTVLLHYLLCERIKKKALFIIAASGIIRERRLLFDENSQMKDDGARSPRSICSSNFYLLGETVIVGPFLVAPNRRL